MAQQQEQRREPAATQQVAAGSKTELYRVAGPGGVFVSSKLTDDNGVVRDNTFLASPGDLIELTPEQAKGYGPTIVPADTPQPEAPEKRKGGRYKLLGPESLLSDVEVERDGKKIRETRTFKPGDTVTLSDEDARNPGLHIVAA